MSIHAFVTDSSAATNGSRSDSFARPQRRIVHICTRFAKGGSEQRLKDMIAALPHDEHIVIIGRDSDLDDAIDKLPQARVLIEPALLRSIHPVRDPLALLHLRRSIKDLKSDIVVTHQSKAGVLGRIAAKAAGAPPVVHSLSMADFGPGYGVIESRLFRLLERTLARWTSAYAVVGSDLASRFGQIGVPRDRMTVIRSAARLPRAGTSRSELRKNVATKYGLSPERPWILYVGSLDQRKNVLDLPILLQQVLQLSTGSAPLLIVAGAGPQENEFRALIEKIGVHDDCRMLGYVSDPGDLFLTTDVVVLLSRAEGLPQVLVQAAAAGTPFVSTDIDGADELLELGATGTVVEMGDVVGAARALLPYLRWPVKKNGAKIDLSSWNPVRVRADYRELFTAVLNPPKPEKNHGFVVAIIGPHGAGKSTLANAIADNRQRFGGTPVIRMSLCRGNAPLSLAERPMKWAKQTVMPEAILKVLRSNVRKNKPDAPRAGDAQHPVNLLHMSLIKTASALALARKTRSQLRRMQRARADGALVISDQFPQVQYPGTVDGPLLDAWTASEDRWRRSLSRWERHPYELADAFQPDLVIRLRISQETANARRPQHDAQQLMANGTIVEELAFERSRFGIVDLNADQSLDVVVEEALSAIFDRMTNTKSVPA